MADHSNSKGATMPTASTSMIEKLAADAATMKKALVRLEKHVTDNATSPSKAPVEKLSQAFNRILPQIEKFERDVKREPTDLCRRGRLQAPRKDMTALMSVLPKLLKAGGAGKPARRRAYIPSGGGSAENEIVINDKKMAQALKAVARGDKGRTGPKDDELPEFNHIHIGGNAKWNLLFNPKSKLVLRDSRFSHDSEMSDSQKAKVKKVAKRAGSKITVVIDGDDISVA